MKRAAPEDPDKDNGGPLFPDPAASKRRVEKGIEDSHAHAVRVDGSWEDGALRTVRDYAEKHPYVVIEDVRKLVGTPEGADARAWGEISRKARKAGWIKPDEPTRDTWGSWKTRWKSLIYRGVVP